MGFMKEFREFALKGNVIDLAVGVIIGGAFGIIIKSMIDDIIMPVVGIAGKADFSNLYLPLNTEVAKAVDAAAKAGAPLGLEGARKVGPVLAYGNFITVAINFAILAFVIFIMVKMFNSARKRFEAEKPATPPPGPSGEEKLLGEIRDLLAAKR